MKFWAIAFKYQEDVFYDFEKKEDSHGLEPSCLLPTEEMASQYIQDELSIEYEPIQIEIETLSKQGVMSWTRQQFEHWDEY